MCEEEHGENEKEMGKRIQAKKLRSANQHISRRLKYVNEIITQGNKITLTYKITYIRAVETSRIKNLEFDFMQAYVQIVPNSF